MSGDDTARGKVTDYAGPAKAPNRPSPWTPFATTLYGLVLAAVLSFIYLIGWIWVYVLRLAD